MHKTIWTVSLWSGLLFSYALTAAPALSKQELTGPVIANVVSVYDGDTLTVDAHPWPQITLRVSVRINGIDTPELRGRCLAEKDQAALARDHTKRLVGQQVTLSQVFLGKYAGRVVADVTTASGIDVAQALVTEGLARIYDGGTRHSWCDGA
jgi:micrococcal nuclease